MNQFYSVNVDEDSLQEFIADLQESHEDIEYLCINLENNPDKLSDLQVIKDHFQHLLISSTKLNLIPITESIEDSLTAIDLLIKWQTYPVAMSEFLLLVIDRVLLLARETTQFQGIDVRNSQHILVALQHIILLDEPHYLIDGINKAIESIVREINHTPESAGSDNDITLFDDADDGVELFTEDCCGREESVTIFAPETILNPVLQARDDIQQCLHCDHPVRLLGEISDAGMDAGTPHTHFLLEMTCAMNNLAGSPVDTEQLMTAICLHDLPLASIPHIINKSERLTKDEIDQIRQHPVLAAVMTGMFDNSNVSHDIVLHHHERVDGSGYPNGLVKDNISDGGKILAIVDSFHSMIESRAYKKFQRSKLRACAEVNACAGTQFDPVWVKYFNQCMKDYWLPLQKPQKTAAS